MPMGLLNANYCLITACLILTKTDYFCRMDPDNEFMNLDFETTTKQKPRKVNTFKERRVSSKLSGKAKNKTQPSQAEIQTNCVLISKEDNDFINRYKQLNSQLIHPCNSNHQLKLPIISKFQQKKSLVKSRSRPASLSIAKCEKVLRDKKKHPLKYKVFCLEMGYTEEEVYKLKQEDIRQLEEEYQRRKGEEYLQQVHMKTRVNGKRQQCIQIPYNTPVSNIKQKDKEMVHKIFGDLAQAAKLKQQLKKQKKPTQSQLKLKQIQLQQEIIGHLLFKRAARHLSKIKKSQLGYLDELRGEKNVDEALFLAIEHKIKKMRLITE